MTPAPGHCRQWGCPPPRERAALLRPRQHDPTLHTIVLCSMSSSRDDPSTATIHSRGGKSSALRCQLWCNYCPLHTRATSHLMEGEGFSTAEVRLTGRSVGRLVGWWGGGGGFGGGKPPLQECLTIADSRGSSITDLLLGSLSFSPCHSHGPLVRCQSSKQARVQGQLWYLCTPPPAESGAQTPRSGPASDPGPAGRHNSYCVEHMYKSGVW